MFNKYPFIKQDSIKNCGSACAYMIIKYYKGYMSLDALNNLFNLDRKGISAYNLIEGLKQIGFKSEGIKTNINDLENIPLPCIAYVTINKSYKHYIVIYKLNINEGKIVIADPCDKVKKITIKEFSDIWSGIVITLIPKKQIKVIKGTKGKIIDIIKEVVSYKSIIIKIFITSFIYMILTIISSFYIKYLFDNLAYNKNLLTFILILFIFINIFKIFSSYVRNELLIYLNENLESVYSMDIFNKLLSLPYCYFKNRTVGEIVSKYNEFMDIKDIINKIILVLFFDLPLIIFSLVVLFIISPHLTILCLLMTLLYLICNFIYSKIFELKMGDLQAKKAELNSYLVESLNGYETIKGLHISKYISSKYNIKLNKYIKSYTSINLSNNNQLLFKDLIQIIELFLFFIGIILIKQNKLLLSNLLTFNALYRFFIEPIKNIISLNLDIITTKKTINNMYEMFIDEEENKGKIKYTHGDIKIKKLYYEDILNNINLNIKKGERVLITGESGSGKSTLLKIIMKYYSNYNGEVLINDVDLKNINSIDNNIVYISQNELLFTDTIYNNVTLNNNSKYFNNVARMCYLDKISNDNLGYNLLIEENGFNISGGQKQRIVLARTLLKKSNILLIDEGLNQIDVNLERKILKKVFKTFKDKTIIIVSHRLDNLDLYNHYICLNQGTITKDDKKNV